MRKGTHSCLECRQRKVRCVSIPDTHKCQGCSARELRCTDQELRRSRSPDLERNRATQERVREFEGILDQVLSDASRVDGQHWPRNAASVRAVEGNSAIRRFPATECEEHRTKSSEIPNLLDPDSSAIHATSSQKFSDEPLLKLFKSVDVTHKDDRNSPKNILASQPSLSVTSEPAHPSLQALRLQIPNSRDLMLILRAGQSSLGLWSASFPDDLGPPGKVTEEQLQDHIYRCLHSDCAASAAKVILCLVLHMQQLPAEFTRANAGFQETSKILQAAYVTAVESLLTADDGPAKTLDGLECMILQSNYYINIGNLRKVWLIVRRAINLAQLLGLHCKMDFRKRPKQAMRGNALWSELWQRDRGFSLILGLPYATLESQLPSLLIKDGSDRQKTEEFLRDLGIVMGHIVDRDQDPSGKTYSNTLKIAEELEECQNTVSAQWWDFRPVPDTPVDAIGGMFMAKMRFYTVERLLHLPFLLKAFEDSKFRNSRLQTLQSSRKIIDVYNILRDEKRPALNLCDMADFQVFAAAMTLAVDLVAFPRPPDDCDPKLEDRDWQLVLQTAIKLRQVSRLIVGCKVAMLGADALEDFSKLSNGAGEQAGKVEIPYFGRVEIRRRKTLLDELAPQVYPHGQASNQSLFQQDSTELFEDANEPRVSNDSYLFPLSPASHLWQETTESWNHMLDSNMADDWTWFPRGNGP